MQITVVSEAPDVRIAVSGRIDTTTAGEFESSVAGLLAGARTFAIDCSDLEYLSSAGLRSLLVTHKRVSLGGGAALILEKVCPSVSEVLTITGFSGIFDVR